MYADAVVVRPAFSDRRLDHGLRHVQGNRFKSEKALRLRPRSGRACDQRDNQHGGDHDETVTRHVRILRVSMARKRGWYAYGRTQVNQGRLQIVKSLSGS